MVGLNEKWVNRVRVPPAPGAICNFLVEFPEVTPVALESIGNWCWIMDEIEQAGCRSTPESPISLA
jgi:hypothetical protein